MRPAYKLVVVESPYAGDVEGNLTYLRACMADCLARGEAPFASHALYTQAGVLDDTVPHERAKGMAAGFAWGERASASVVYIDRGISQGMLAGVEEARVHHRVTFVRSLTAPLQDLAVFDWGAQSKEAIANDLGRLVEAKNVAYGDSFARSGDILAVLYPDGVRPEQYRDVLAIARVVDKLFRIATKKDAFGESPYGDIAGYGIIGVHADQVARAKLLATLAGGRALKASTSLEAHDALAAMHLELGPALDAMVRAEHEAKEPPALEWPPARTCRQCGTTQYTGEDFCDAECREDYGGREVPCDVCGKRFVSRSTFVHHCSDECRNAPRPRKKVA